MATYQKGEPTFEHRVSGALLIAVGTVGKVVREDKAQDEDGTIVTRTHEVELDRVIKGEAPDPQVYVRIVVEGPRKKDRGPALEEGKRMMLFLAPDYGPGRTEREFVLFSSGAHAIEGERVHVGKDLVKGIIGPDVKHDEEAVSLDEMTRVVELTAKKQKRAREAERTVLPAEVREHPEVRERPDEKERAVPPTMAREQPADKSEHRPRHIEPSKGGGPAEPGVK